MKKTIFICLLFLSFFACKKKDDPDPGPSGTPIANVTPSDSTNYQALFSCLNVYSKISGTYTPIGKQTAAYYSSQLITNEIYTASNLQDMGIVSLDSILFKSKSAITNHYYNDTTGTQFTLPYKWIVSGTPAIASFSFSNSNTPPTFTASANIPDSIKISSGFSINIKGTTDCSLIRVFILGGNGSTSFPNKLIAGTDSLINFSATDLQGVNATNTGYISIQFNRDHYRSIAGKRINFRTGLQYINTAFKIKP
ncbi:MAG: hypothetical protein H0U95_10430 [Bacteroidetes bacterium]|nr:hypothetical protein [Bacteroidota bacterium]